MQTANDVIETIKTLPVLEKDKVFDWVEAERHQSDERPPNGNEVEAPLKRFRKAQDWVRKNRAEYMNQWVCLDGDRLIAHGFDALEVDRQAIAAGITVPYLEHIVEETDLGGW